KTVDFHWGTSGVPPQRANTGRAGDPGVSPQLSQNYSVRWAGVLAPEATGDYVLGFSGQDGYRLWLDGKVIAEDWTTHRPATVGSQQLHLIQNHAYAIKIEYFQTVRFAEARLVWSIPEVERQAALKAARDADLVIM